ncbi:MAG: PIN domain-containing protein [Chloroflexota bacterium]
MKRAVIDINVLISAVVAPLGMPRQILTLWKERVFLPLISPGMVQTLDEKLRLPRIVRRYNLGDADRLWIERLIFGYASAVPV